MKIALFGYGKMGQAIENEALKKGYEISLIINSQNAHMKTVEALKDVDVIIEFSRPESAVSNIMMAIEAGTPIISGTTGWLDQMDTVRQACQNKKGAFLYASNFSIGVNLFFQLNKMLAKTMNAYPQYQPSLEEIHHTQKLDAPSGTAITLANDLLDKVDRKDAWVKGAAASATDLAVMSKRIDQVPGTHSIEWTSAIDTIEIKHTAHSRKGFVLGALLAAEWIVGKEGFFGMEDVLF